MHRTKAYLGHRTGFFVLGLISASRQGADLLEEYGWVATRTPLGQTTGLCLPNDIDRFAEVSRVIPLFAILGLFG